MAKRLLSILLLFLYLVPSIGVSGFVHYCGGEIAAIVIIPSDKHPCGCAPSKPMDSGCCQDKAFSFKIKDNHKNVDAKVLVNDISDVVFVQKLHPISDVVLFLSDKKTQFRVKEKEPPDKRLFILYESYLI